MVQKMTCPGCGSHTSGVLDAHVEGTPCPVCGRPPSAPPEALYPDLVYLSHEELESEVTALRHTINAMRDDLAKVRGYQLELAERCYRKDLELDELRRACFRYPHCEAHEACGWPQCADELRDRRQAQSRRD